MSTTEEETTPPEPSFAASEEFGVEAVIARWRDEREDVPDETGEEGDTRPETIEEWKARTGFDHTVEVELQSIDEQIASLETRKQELEDQKAAITEGAPEAPPAEEPPPPEEPVA